MHYHQVVEAIELPCDCDILVKGKDKQYRLKGQKGDFLVIEGDSLNIYGKKAFFERFKPYYEKTVPITIKPNPIPYRITWSNTSAAETTVSAPSTGSEEAW